MNTLMIVIAVLLAGAAIVTILAFSLGWFRLAPVPLESKVSFILMRKKNVGADDFKNTPINTTFLGPKTSKDQSSNKESH